MAFSALFNTNGESCDKCKKEMTSQRPGMTLTTSDRSGKHVIWIHLSCMQAQINKLWQQANIEIEVEP